MKKGSIKGMDGKELEAYFPTDFKLLDLNNLNELDVNENSAGCGAHEEVVKKKCCGGDCHSKKADFPTTLSWDAPKEMIKDVIEKAKAANKEVNPQHKDTSTSYDYPLDKAFQYGYDIESDPINKLFKMAANFPAQNKVKIDDTIESDLLETEVLKLGALYRVAGVDLVVRFTGSFATTVPDGNKILLQIKHHGTLLYVGEKSLIRASRVDVKNYVNEPF